MCGILGFTHLNKRLPEGTFALALASLVHRGPDQQGQFVSGHIFLGATRLKVLDLEGGDQPLRSPDGDVVLVFNGEIFNYRELRQEPEVEGITFQTRCDSEVVLNAYLSWGNACFQRMRGMFAIAIWSQSECRLTLVRDRMGIKPLYYFLHSDPIALAGILNEIKREPGVERYLDFDQCFYLPDDILYKVDRMSMAHALEVRPPFLDSRIVDFAARLPESMKIKGRTSKYILRSLMKDKLPTSVLSRPKDRPGYSDP